MLFSSFAFILFFFPAALAGFYLFARMGRKPALAWIVLASACYYAYDQPHYLWLIATSTVANYLFGRALDRHRSRWILVAGLCFNLGVLGWFKYSYFIYENLSLLVELPSFSRLALPLGISFVTFQKIAYLVDCWRGEKPERRLLPFAAFVFFFPQLIAGPIVHPRQMLPQLRSDRFLRFSIEHLAQGLTLFVIGLSKKLLLADPLSAYVSPVYAQLAKGGAEVADIWLAVLAYPLQLYFDFSGYSDMAIGAALCFNLRLPQNFASPYKARSIIEFWRHWHMTLSGFLRDYVYIPLGGSRKGRLRKYINLMATMLLGGLWHGAGWNFIIWGALHGFYLGINHLCRGRMPGWFSPLAWPLTLVAVVVAWVFFRAHSFGDALVALQALAHPLQAAYGMAAQWQVLAHILLCWLVVLLLPNSLELMRMSEPKSGVFSRFVFRLALPWAVACGAALTFNLLRLTEVSEFIYFHF